MIDLHSHTTASDGEHAPTELLELASKAGVTHLAVTDHDNVEGLAEAAGAAARLGIELICGIEISALWNGREIHILGHFLDPENAPLRSFAKHMRGERDRRMERMVARMVELGYPLTMDDVRRVAGDAGLGRPHLARALVEAGHCTSVPAAFDELLADGRPGAVERERLPSAEAIAMIHAAGGTATVAHPLSSRVSPESIEKLAALGLDGVEAAHADCPPSDRRRMEAVTRRLGLVATAGSDYHGPVTTPHRKLGSASMAPEAFEALRARAGRHTSEAAALRQAR